MGIDEVPNRRLERAHTAMGTAPQLFIRQVGEPALDQVQPRPVRGCEMHVEARSLQQPIFDERRLMSPVVVHDDVDGKLRRHLRVDRIEKLPELGRAMPTMKLRDQLAGFRVERGKQRGGAVPFVVMRPPLDLTGAHRQQRLVRSSAWIWDFSSTQRTTAWVGGCM
jgi:hypothetical protein